MAGDELVYRLILDSQDNTSGNNFGSGSSRPAKPAGDDTTTQNVIALEQARAKIRREDAAELMDQQYRSLKRGMPLTRIQDEDHQKKLDDAEAEAERVKEAARKEAEAQRKAADRLRVQGEERQARDEDWLFREEKRIEREKQQQQLQGEERQNRDEDWYERDQLRAQKEAEAEAERQRKAAQAANPSYLASQVIEKEKLYEQTRLQVEATKRGVTPEEVANEERARETAKNAAGYVQAGAGLISSAAGGPLSLINKIASFSPITGPIVSAVSGVVSQLKSFHDEMRPVLLQAARYSPEVIVGNIQNKIAAMKQDMQISKDKGAQIAEQEKKNAFMDRAMKDADVAAAANPNSPMNKLVREWNLLQLGWKNIMAGRVEPEDVPFGKMIAANIERGHGLFDNVTEKGKAALWNWAVKEALGGGFNHRGPFEFRVHRVGHVPGIGGAVGAAVPFIKPKGLANPQMPGG